MTLRPRFRLLVLPLPFLLAACETAEPFDPGECETRQEDVIVTTQAEVDALTGVCAIYGALHISEALDTQDPITTLAPLADLRTVGTEHWSALRILGTTDLKGLEGLERVTLTDGAELRIQGNLALESLAALGADAEGEIRRLSYVHVWQNSSLVDLTGLANVLAPAGAEVTAMLSIYDNRALTSLAGLEGITGPIALMDLRSAPALTTLAGLPNVAYGSLHLIDLPLTTLDLEVPSVGDFLRIERNPALTSLSITAQEVGRNLTVSQNWALTTLSVALDRAPQHMVVNESRELTTFDLALAEGGLGGFSLGQAPALTTLGFQGVLLQRGLALYDTGLADLDAFAPTATLEDWLILVGNDHLADIDAFSGVASTGQLQVQDNPTLCVPAWLKSVTVTGITAASISGNLCD